MLSLSRAVAFGATLVSVVQANDWLVLSQVRTIEVNRVDPLVNPGANGPHVHTIMGGNAFSPYSTSAESLEKSTCSSSMIQDDKSAYWAPAVYYNHGNGSYSTVRSSTRIYYFMKPGNGTKPVVAFPRGHRMLAGPPADTRPTPPPKGVLSDQQRAALDPRVGAIMIGCSAGAVQGQGSGGSMDGQRPWLPNDAPKGCGVLNMGIFFPSCSDGRLDSPDHFDHMRYPLDSSNGYNCPSSHPIKLPTMFMEVFYFPGDDQPYRGPNQDNWILSNGDTTGNTYHADFINAWTPGVLEDVMKQCNTPNAPGDNLSACAPLAKSLSVDAADKCRSTGDIVKEPVGILAPINELPGCNKWALDQKSHPTCKGDQVPMGQPAGRATDDEFKVSLPISEFEASGASNKGTVQSGSSSSASSTSSTSSTSSVASTSTSSAATTSTSSSSEAAAAKGETSTSAASTASAVPTTTSAYDYNYGAGPAGSSSSSAPTSATTTSSTDDYNYGAVPNPAATSVDSSSSAAATSAATTTTASTDDYNYGAIPAPAVTSVASSSSSAVPTTTASSGDYNYGAVPAPGVNSSSSSAVLTSAAHPAAINPPASTSVSVTTSVSVNTPTSTASATPTPQKANVVGGGPKKPMRTCRPKHRKPHHGNRRREWKRRMV